MERKKKSKAEEVEVNGAMKVTSKILKYSLRNGGHYREKKRDGPRPESIQIMKHVMDFSTHFHNYPRPLAPELVTFITAKDDLYMPHKAVEDFRTLWPGE